MLTHEAENGTNPLSAVIWDKAGERIMAEAAECAATIPRYGRLSERAQWLSVTGRTRADAEPRAQQPHPGAGSR